jgi:hypothetical protein
MKRSILFFLLIVVFLSSTGASIIDKETKQGVLSLDQKLDRLVQKEEGYHNEQTRLLREQRELIQKLMQRIDALERQVKASQSAKPAPTPPPTPPAPALTVSPPAPPPPALPPPAPASVTPPVASPNPAPPPVIAPPQPVAPPPAAQTPQAPPLPVAVVPPPTPEPVATPVTPAPPKDLSPSKPPKSPPKPLPPPTLATTRQDPLGKKMKSMESATLFAFFLSGFCLLLVVGLLIRLKKGEDRLKKMLWKSETEALREEVVRGRPVLKILIEGERIDLVNTGETTADEIKMLVGPAPASMKQKIGTVPRLKTGERFEIDLHSQLSTNPLYATVEYKNVNTGRIYKDQFVLKVDRLTGNVLPIQQAS